MAAHDLLTFLAQGGSLRMLAEIDKAHLQTLYAFACQAVKGGDITQAENLLDALFCLDSWDFNYALSLGLCRQMRGAHEEALFCFNRASTVKITDPRPPYYAALSYQKMGNVSYAKRAFLAARRWASNQPEYQELRQDAERLLADLPEQSAQQSST